MDFKHIETELKKRINACFDGGAPLPYILNWSAWNEICWLLNICRLPYKK